MRILFHLHGFPPAHNAGAETMAKDISQAMAQRGHGVKVLAGHGLYGIEEHYQGAVHVLPDTVQNKTWYGWADLIVTHLDYTRKVIDFAKDMHIPVALLVHNGGYLKQYNVKASEVALVVFNTQHLSRASTFNGPRTICRPLLVDPSAWLRIPNPDGAITLANLNVDKGALLFWELARRMPEQQFLAVRGSHGVQIVPPDVPPNVEVIPNVADIRPILSRTGVLLMPSRVESWGRMALEACAAGIPVVAHKTPGLVECLSGAGFILDSLEPELWQELLSYRSQWWEERREAGLRRAAELDPVKEFDALEQAFVAAASPGRRRMDVLATMEHFLAHALPVYDALEPQHRGMIHVLPEMLRHEVQSPRIWCTWEERPNHRLHSPGIFRRGEGPVLVAASRDLNSTAGYQRRPVLMEHGAGQSYSNKHPSYAGGAGRHRCEAILVPGKHPAERTRKVYPNIPVHVIGCPRIEPYIGIKPQNEKPVVALSFHWNCVVVPETKTSWPHFDGVLLELQKHPEWTVIGHGHPRIIQQLRPWYEKHGIPVVSWEYVLEHADVYVCDNSSTLYEFAATGRPVVLLNAPWYRRDVEHGMRFWAHAGMGPQCSGVADVAPAIQKVLTEDVWSEERQRVVSEVYGILEGSSKEAATAMMSVLTAQEVTDMARAPGPFEMVGKQTFKGKEGWVRRGMRFRVATYERAQELVRRNLADYASPEEAEKASPHSKAVAVDKEPGGDVPDSAGGEGEEDEATGGISFACEVCGKKFSSILKVTLHRGRMKDDAHTKYQEGLDSAERNKRKAEEDKRREQVGGARGR